MKTRNEIYQGEGAKLLRFITTYHTLKYDQVLQLFSRHEQSIKSLVTSLIKQGRIIYDKEHDLLCDSQQSAENPDYAIITCFWVLLDFKKGIVYCRPAPCKYSVISGLFTTAPLSNNAVNTKTIFLFI